MNIHMKTFSNFLSLEKTDWNMLYTEQMPKIYNYFRYRVGNNMLAEDLTAATFEKAWRARDSFQRRKASFVTWLYTIARNTMADHFRKSHKVQHLEIDERVPSEDAEPEDKLAAKQTIQTLVSMLENYSPRERDLIALKYGSGLRNREIAKLTGLSETNVGSILHRTVSKLRKAMEQNYE